MQANCQDPKYDKESAKWGPGPALFKFKYYNGT